MLYERSSYDHNVRNFIRERALTDRVRSNAIVQAQTSIERTSIVHTSAYTKHVQCTAQRVGYNNVACRTNVGLLLQMRISQLYRTKSCDVRSTTDARGQSRKLTKRETTLEQQRHESARAKVTYLENAADE